MPAHTINAVIVCDDIRKEVTGKDLILGVYTGSVVLGEFPSWFGPAFWIEVDFSETGDFELNFRLSITGKPPMPFTMRAHVSNPGPSAGVVQGLQILIEEETELVLEIREGDDWKVIKRKKVVAGKLTFSGPNDYRHPSAR
jgi:hypothetical protein